MITSECKGVVGVQGELSVFGLRAVARANVAVRKINMKMFILL